MKVFAFPLIPFTIFLSLGIVCNRFLNLSQNVSSLLFTIAFIVLFYFWFKAKKSWKPNSSFGKATYVLAFAFGVLIQSFHFQPNSKNHYSHFLNQQNTCEVKGLIVSNLKPTTKNTKHVFRITEINAKKVSGNLIIYCEKENIEPLIPGNEIQFLTSIQPIPKNFNPYQFDYAYYLQNQNIFHQSFIKSENFVVLNKHKNWNWFWYSLQNDLINSFNIHHFKAETQAILNALLFGQRKLLDKETITAYSNAGIVHILAISGLHVGILYFMLLFFLKPLQKLKRGNITTLLLTLCFLWSFAIVTGLSASVTRAVTMFSIIAIGKFINRDSNIYNTIAFSALLLLVFNPNFIFDIGFQMSYAAVLAIVALNPFFYYFHFTKSKIVKFFIDIILVSLAAQIGVLPLSLYYFNQFPILFLLANIVVIPLTILILWSSLATLILNFILPKIALFIGVVLEFAIDLMNRYAKWISSFTELVLRNISFSGTLCVLAYISILSFLFWCYKRTQKRFQYFLIGIVLFQLGYLLTKTNQISKNELIVFNSKSALIGLKSEDKISFYTNESELNLENINHYKRGNFVDEAVIFPLENVYKFNRNRILVIDSIYVSSPEKPTILLLTGNPKINLERILIETNPKQVIADNSNPYYKIEQWKVTCKKRKIPFHATAEKGFYKLN